MFLTLGFYHRLVCTLSLLYILSGSIVLSVHGFREHGTLLRVLTMALAASIVTFISRLIPYTSRVDEEAPLSRAGKHFVYVSTALVSWFPLVITAALVLFGVDSGSGTVNACQKDWFLTLTCAPIAGEEIFAILLFFSLACDSYAIHERAIALHGEAEIPLPVGLRHPANLYPIQLFGPGSAVPQWMLAHVGDIEHEYAPGSTSAVQLPQTVA